jgi:2-methylisocitrate lyase-like PEP mutase family enzyme
MASRHQNSPARLQELLKRPQILVVPCCYDALSATLIEQAGFEAMFVSGASLTNACMGISDVGLMSYGEFKQVFHNILSITSIPVMVDVDTGYGGILPIMRLVEEFEAMGIAGIQMEDQIFPKRCAFFGTTVVSAEEMCGRIKAAVKARANPDFLIVARTDCVCSLGFDEALRRVQAYYEAGADMIFMNTPPSADAVRKLAELQMPKCTSVVEGSPTENDTPEDLQKIGYKMVKYPQTLIRATIKTQMDILHSLKATGRTADYRDRLCTSKERADFTHLQKYTNFEWGYNK